MCPDKRKRPALLAALLLLSACAAPAEDIPPPTPPSPTAPTPTDAPITEAPKTLWGFPIDDTHDAFEVPTGGKLGTVLVTVEAEVEEVGYGYDLYFSVWRSDDLTTPIQTFEVEENHTFHWNNVIDANFDGHTDFGYMYAMGNQPTYWHYWIWNEQQGLFMPEPGFDEISSPQFDTEEETIEGWNRDSCCSGTETYHRWENGELICFCKVEYTYPDENWYQEKVVYERISGELVEVSREPYQMMG